MIGLSISIGSGQNGGQRSGNRSLTLSGLIDGAARPGSASGITAAFSDGFPIQSLSWGMTPGGTEFGTGASPQDFSSADTGLFDAPGLLHVTARAAGRSYSLSVPIRTAPPVFLTPPAFAAPLYKIGEAVEVSLGTVDAAPATLTVASFTLDGEDRRSGLAGLAWSSAGETAWGRAGVLRLQARAESSGGVVLSEPVTARLGDAPRAFSAADWSVDETGVQIAALPDDGNVPITNIRYRIDGGPDRSVNGVTDFALADYGDIQIRAVNALGIGAWSDTKTRIAQTPTLSIEAAPLLAEVAAVEGNTLTATAGPVSGGPSSRTWQWYRGTAAISGATGESYMLQPADIGQRIKVRQIETPVGGSPVTRDSAASPVVVALNFQAQDNGDGTFGITYADGARSTVEFVLSQPTVYAGSFNLDLAALETGPICLVQPALSGTPAVGAALSATPFLWVYPEALGALSVSSGWRRNETVLAGESGSTHTVTAADAGTDLQYIETGTQSGAAAPVTAASPSVRIGEAAAVLSGVSGTRSAAGQITVTLSTDWGEGTIFYVVTGGAAPSAAQIAAGTGADGTPLAVPYRGSMPVVAAGPQTLTISGLAEPISATVHLVQQTGSGVQSVPVSTARIASPVTSGYSPQSSASALAWWDASDEATITHAAGAVSQIADKIGTAHLTGTGTTGVGASDVNGLNTIVMDGTSDYLATAGVYPFPADGNWVLTIIADIGAVNDYMDSLFSAEFGSVNAYLRASSSVYFAGKLYVGAANQAVSPQIGAGLHTVQIVADKENNVARCFVDGEEVFTLAYPTAVDSPVVQFFRFGTSKNLGGKFLEVFIDSDTGTQAGALAFATKKWAL
ncbi:hypothetical protein JMM63_01620 [Rhodovulum sulfidophilum]|uniref:hypothetical protein n=1 Tax=Rhodovulum sulfidophilum TaxID=35806 RepID=UPI001921DFB9|nr:hypothetical protein [Rhodovulum sulfidophilum]MBL3594284.1 hypothetical protein [Rhodovulum sulfidophilum]